MYSKTPVSDSSDMAQKSSRNPMLDDDTPGAGTQQEASDDHCDDSSAGYDKTSSSRQTPWFPPSKEAPPLSYTVQMNFMWCVVLALAFITRFWRIDFPSYVV